MASLELSQDLVGVSLRVKTLTGESFDGTVYCYDQPRALLVLHEQCDTLTRSNFRFFKTDCLTEVARLSPDHVQMPEPLNLESKLARINIPKVTSNAAQAIQERSRKMGAEVTIEAQDIFDSINRTLRCTWDHAAIIVIEEVRIEPPYTPEKVRHISSQPKGGAGGAWETGKTGEDTPTGEKTPMDKTVEHVKKVLEGVRLKLKLNHPSSKK